MIEKKDILKMIKNVSKRAQGKPDKRLIHPNREWMIGLIIFLAVVIGGAALSAQVYFNLDNLEDNIADTDTRVIRYQEANVEKAINRYNAAAEAFAAIANTIQARPVETQVEENSDSNEETIESAEADTVVIEESDSNVVSE